ncbi:hypothetical protein OSB04_un001766 [Centaurea solstitialis]|uniref:Uncharacterized protein n=1 Tax=Centaurea solstitialis TaxID=347529 RepID=A0AA38S2R8_9ASTR|nr:hypothetical protein OSB04_un001766 [Centaurea solstitialis]
MGIFPGSVETRKAIQRELEKERIREEILSEEIAHKRDLEAEVRREMAMEMAIHGDRGFPSSFPLGHTNPLQPGMPPFAPVSFEEKFGGRCEIGDGKKKVIDLGNPNGGAKGKPVSEWSCAVCKVSAPCEQGFKEHLVGKKHQAQMATLKAKNTQKHATQHNKTSKKQSGEIGLGVKSTTTVETESSKSNKSVKTQPPPLKKKNTSKSDSKQEEDTKNESWFSCDMCNVGASCHEVMNAHIKGKKHLKNLLKLHQESGN